MSESTSIVNFGDWGKPATVLVEKIADAIGGVARPYQIVRVAKAEAEAEKIRAESRIQVAKAERRAMRRFLAEETKKQINIEAIIAKALPEVKEDSNPERVEDDWIANFFDKCRLISDQDMQKLWARILAGEANSPGKFSKITVNVVANLEARDARLFSSLCAFVMRADDPLPLVFDMGNPIYSERGVDFENLSHLQNIGLLNLSNSGMFRYTDPRQFSPRKIDLEYFGRTLHIESPIVGSVGIEIGYVFLTMAGGQLASVSSAEPREGFIEFVIQQWVQRGYEVTIDQ